MNENNKLPSIPDSISSIADDEAITEIDLGDFLTENSNSDSLFEGFRDDIEKTEKSLESDLQSLYDDIMGSGPETIVPRPLSMLTESEAEPRKVVLSDPEPLPEDENSSLEDIWMNPDDYFDSDIPVVSLDNGEETEETEIFEPVPEEEAEIVSDDAKAGIFSMIDMLKKETDSETGFDDILSEIESNQGIATVDAELSSAIHLVSGPDESVEETELLPEEEEEELDFSEDDFDWDGFLEEEPAEAPVSEEPEIILPEIEEVPVSEEPEAEEKKEFVITVPDDGNDYERAAAQPEKLYESAPMSSANIMEESELEGEDKKEKKKKATTGDIIRNIILTISIITIIVCGGMLANVYIIEPYRFKAEADKIASEMNENINIHNDVTVNDSMNTSPEKVYPEGMLAKYSSLYDANDDLRGWISIPGFGINLPIAQGSNNNYYLKKDIYGKYTRYGVPFFDYRMTDFQNLHKNNVIYGHNMRHDDLIFGMLENYRSIDGFRQAPVIECNTIYGDHTWFVYAVFITNSEKEDDNGYVFPYNFIDLDTGNFVKYLEEVDARKLYTTGVDIALTDKLLTLSTCAYDFDNARLVVVARQRREGESVAVDTSKAYKNNDPKYPQAWYDAYGKTNTHANDPRW